MKRTTLLLALAALLSVAACGDDDPATPTPPAVHEATADFWNFLVADGATDTRLTFFKDTDTAIDTGILPIGGTSGHTIALSDPSASAVLGYALSNPAGTSLEASASYPMEENRRYRLAACGILGSSDLNSRPRMVQMDALEAPAAGQVTLRAFHALAGNPVAVDVHVNGLVIAGLDFGEATPAVTFAARAADQDTLLIVPAGQEPDGSNEIIAARGISLFNADTRYELTVVHQTSGIYNGDVNGAARYSLFGQQ